MASNVFHAEKIKALFFILNFVVVIGKVLRKLLDYSQRSLMKVEMNLDVAHMIMMKYFFQLFIPMILF
jgi:hypothetical protein